MNMQLAMDFQKTRNNIISPQIKGIHKLNTEKQIHYTRVETRSGQPGYPGQLGHVLSGSSGYDSIHKISRSDPDSKSNELSILNDDDRSVSLIFFIIFCRIECTIRVFWSFSNWIMHNCTPQKHTATITIHIHIILYKIQMPLFSDHSKRQQYCSIKNATNQPL